MEGWERQQDGGTDAGSGEEPKLPGCQGSFTVQLSCDLVCWELTTTYWYSISMEGDEWR